MINVTTAIIKRNGKILLAKRSVTSSLSNKREFPDGKVEVTRDLRNLSKLFRDDHRMGDRAGIIL
ncbi:MAG: hypothetical protein KJO26_14460 [Deltaproteobacteria bacterium]|nr:hypothetical protein [Deltaproteobacteria bacterium]